MQFDVEHISFSYRDKRVLENVSFSLKSGDVISLLGRNGSGKTTLLRLLLGFLKPESGRLSIDSVPIEEISLNERAKRIAYIPQYSDLAFPMTVLDTVVMGRAPNISTFSKPGKSDYEIAMKNLELMGIESLKDKSMGKISGGERQLALIARALTQDAKILLLDEPTSALDYSNQIMVLEKVNELAKKDYSILYSTHNPEQALMLSSSVLILDRGVSEYYRKPDELFDGKRLSRLYGINLYLEKIDTGENRRIICIPK